MAWEDGGKFCTWEGITCAVNTTRVSSLILPSVELEGALALVVRTGPVPQRAQHHTKERSLLAPREGHFLLVMWCGTPCRISQRLI